MHTVFTLVSIVAIANLVIGIVLGLTGISGFLLPLLYAGVLGMPVHDSLALSFLAFAVSGLIGAHSYWRTNNMDLKLAILLSIGSLPGALLGVQINVLIPGFLAKLLLYVFVLFAGLSIFFKKNKQDTGIRRSPLLDQPVPVLLLGFGTAVICALTGAGGPILLVPILASLGVGIRPAVGVSLLNSVVIALPSIFGYFAHASASMTPTLIAASLAGMIAGMLTGARLSNKVPIRQLKMFIAVLTIATSVYMLLTLLV